MATGNDERPLTVVLGATGLRRSGGYVSADNLGDLHGALGARTYAEMGRNDPVCAAMLFAVTALVRAVRWRVDAAERPSRDAQAAQMFVERVLFRDLRPNWSEVISEACGMFTYGYLPMEIIWGYHEESRLIVPVTLAPRSPETTDRWEFTPTGALRGWWQYDEQRGSAYLPLEKLLLFRTESSLANPEARSLLRACYVPWRRKKAIEEAEGRMALRAAGVAVVRVPGKLFAADASAEERAALAAFQQMATNLASDRHGALVLPSDVQPDGGLLYDLQYVVADGRRSIDMSMMVDRIDRRMAMTILADFLFLGQGATGSFALSADKTELFAEALKGWLRNIADTVNRDLLPRWFRLNGLPLDLLPTVAFDDIERPALTEVAQYLTTLAGVGMPLFPDDALDAHLRKLGNLPPSSGTAVPPEPEAPPDA